MLNFLRRSWGVRRGTAGAVSLVFALQLILAGLISTQMAATAAAGHADYFEICYGNGAPSDQGGIGGKAFHQTCAVCTLASAAPPLPEVVAIDIPAFAGVPVRIEAEPQVLIAARRHNPRTSQGPPQTA